MVSLVQCIARRLRAHGCGHAFGIPGGEVLAVLEALDAEGIRFTLVKHENAGGFMAEGTQHVTGAPGVLLATIGPGVVNAVNTVANALQDQVPLIVISGCVDAAEAATYTHQVLDHQAVLRPVTKASFMVVPGAAEVIVDRALALALSYPQGPVHLDVPIRAAGAPERSSGRPLIPPRAPMGPAPGAALEDARARLAAAQRPLMMAGVGAVQQGAGERIRGLCERLEMPLLTTYKGKGLLDEDHPLALGGHGLSPRSDALVMPLLEAADLILAVGYDPIEMRIGWREPWTADKAIELAHLPSLHGMHGAAVSFVGDLCAGLDALALAVPDRRVTWPEGQPTRTREALAELFAPRESFGPHAAFAAARRVSPRDTVVTADSGAHRILLSQMWTCHAPRSLLQSSALCTMGCALPLAIGHRIADPTRPVLAVMGDAGLEMVLGELATLRDLKTPLVVMVMVDHSLALIELKQRSAGLDNLGVNFGATDFAAVAVAMGGIGVDVHDVEALESALADAYRAETFTLLAVHIDQRAYEGAF